MARVLLRAHPRLRPEAQRLAAGLLDAQERAAVAMDVTDRLRALHLRDLADRAGPRWGGGYVEPHEAADELLTEAIQPFVDDLERRARIGAVAAATEIGLGLLLGMYACRDEDDNDRVLTHAGMPDAVDHLASCVVSEWSSVGWSCPTTGWPGSAPPGGGIRGTVPDRTFQPLAA